MTYSEKKRRTTIRDVATEANVSTSTVSLFVRDQTSVGEAVGERIAEAIQKLNYIPRSRTNGVTGPKLFGLLVEKLPIPAFADVFYGEVIRGLEATAKEHGYGILFSIMEGNQLPPMITETQVCGVLTLGGGPANDALAAQLTQYQIPSVLVDNYVPGISAHAIVPDNQWGGYCAMQHLIELGHQRIALIKGPNKYKTLTDRVQGVLRAANEAQLIIPPEYQQESLSAGRANKGYLEMKQLLSLPQPPTAVFAVSDKTAFGAFQAIKEAGLSIPKDISVVGFDNVADTDPPLTTIDIPKFEMGELAMHRLIDMVNKQTMLPVRISVYTQLIVRASTAPPNL